MVVELITHGITNPRMKILESGRLEFQESPPSLSNLGRNQLFLLGKQTKERFPELLEDLSVKEGHYLLSSDFDFTIESSMSHFYGLSNQFSDIPLTNNYGVSNSTSNTSLKTGSGNEDLLPPHPPNKLNITQKLDALINVPFKTALPDGL